MVRVQLAGISVQMNNRFPELESLCREYVTNESPKIVLSATQEEIEEERSKQADIFSDGYLETICLYRKLALEILKFDVFLMHASVVEVDGEGYAFLAHSGTGKTTQTRLWLEHFGDDACVVNGDKPLIRMIPTDGGYQFFAYGTPWCGKEGMNSNQHVPLRAMFLVQRAPEPSCITVSTDISLPLVFRQLLLPKQPQALEHMLDLADHLLNTVPCWLLRCNMKDESVTAAFDAVNG